MADDPRDEEAGYPRDTPAEPEDTEAETEGHYRRRMGEVEPDLGRTGRWGYLFWVTLWVIVLVAIALIYVLAGRSI